MDHVEECPSYYVDCWGTICDCDYMHICMCRELRACEVRVEESMDRAWSQTVQLAVAHTRTATLDAAREAVAALVPSEFWEGIEGRRSQWWIVKAEAIAAIDALREKQ